MGDWQPYNRGRSIGVKGSEGSKVVRDEEHPLGARMTIKQGQDYVSVSCNISGKIDHTRFFKEMKAAEHEYMNMQKELVEVMSAISSAKAADIKVWEAISGFVTRFP
jgi:hypothetical protein